MEGSKLTCRKGVVVAKGCTLERENNKINEEEEGDKI